MKVVDSGSKLPGMIKRMSMGARFSGLITSTYRRSQGNNPDVRGINK